MWKTCKQIFSLDCTFDREFSSWTSRSWKWEISIMKEIFCLYMWETKFLLVFFFFKFVSKVLFRKKIRRSEDIGSTSTILEKNRSFVFKLSFSHSHYLKQFLWKMCKQLFSTYLDDYLSVVERLTLYRNVWAQFIQRALYWIYGRRNPAVSPLTNKH